MWYKGVLGAQVSTYTSQFMGPLHAKQSERSERPTLVSFTLYSQTLWTETPKYDSMSLRKK